MFIARPSLCDSAVNNYEGFKYDGLQKRKKKQDNFWIKLVDSEVNLATYNVLQVMFSA